MLAGCLTGACNATMCPIYVGLPPLTSSGTPFTVLELRAMMREICADDNNVAKFSFVEYLAWSCKEGVPPPHLRITHPYMTHPMTHPYMTWSCKEGVPPPNLRITVEPALPKSPSKGERKCGKGAGAGAGAGAWV